MNKELANSRLDYRRYSNFNVRTSFVFKRYSVIQISLWWNLYFQVCHRKGYMMNPQIEVFHNRISHKQEQEKVNAND